MPSTNSKRKVSIDTNALFALMEPWPESWSVSDDDIPIGQGLVAEFKPFIAHLASLGLTSKTVRKHLDSCWVIGGEIIRDVDEQPKRCKTPPLQLLLNAVDCDEAPLIYDASEEEQRGFDATARKLHHFLNSNPQS